MCAIPKKLNGANSQIYHSGILLNSAHGKRYLSLRRNSPVLRRLSAIGLKTAKRTNKLEAVPAHRKHSTDKSPCASSQTRTACILHSQFGMSRFIELQRPILSTSHNSLSISAHVRRARIFTTALYPHGAGGAR